MLEWLQVKIAFESGSAFEQRLHESAGVKGLQVFNVFADANIFHRHAEFFLDANDHPAFGGAVEFGEHDAGDIRRFFEHAGLLQAVLAGRRALGAF